MDILLHKILDNLSAETDQSTKHVMAVILLASFKKQEALNIPLEKCWQVIVIASSNRRTNHILAYCYLCCCTALPGEKSKGM